MNHSDDVNNCRSEATLVFSMMADFIHMGQGVRLGYLVIHAPTIVFPR